MYRLTRFLLAFEMLLLAFSAQAQVVTEFSVGISANAYLQGITAGSDGNIWFTEYSGSRIGRITPSGEVTEFRLSALQYPTSITTGPDGNLWFIESGNSGWNPNIGRITPTGVVTEFSLGGGTPSPSGIVAGRDGNLWITLFDYLARMTTSGLETSVPILHSFEYPTCITAGPDGNLWYTESGYGFKSTIARITTAGVITEFNTGIDSGGGFPCIAAGPDGNLWFTGYNGNLIGRITPAGVVTQFSAGISANAYPYSITAGPDGNLWFTEPGANRIGRITPAGVVTEFSAGISAGAGPTGITAGPDGNIWFTEPGVNRIGRITIGSGGTTTTATTTTTTATSTTTTTLPSSTATLNFVDGWNLVGNSSSGSLNVAAVFGDTSEVLTIWKWNANGGKWAFYTPSLVGQALTDYATTHGFDVLSTINSGEGFWVNAKTAFTAQLPVGTAKTSASYKTSLATGWNLIAVGDSPTPHAFNNAVNVTTLWAWDAVKTDWYFYAPDLDAQGGSALSNYITSRNYLDFGTKTLDPTMGFWVNVAATTTPNTDNILRLKWPLATSYASRVVTQAFGADWAGGVYCDGLIKKHNGTDFHATAGTAVYAAETGNVKEVMTPSQTGGWAHNIVLEHTSSTGGKYTTVYWHVTPVSAVVVAPTGSPSTSIPKGMQIATVADLTPYGNATHFHFGVRNGAYLAGVSGTGALPQTTCGGYPAFPGDFIDPNSTNSVLFQ